MNKVWMRCCGDKCRLFDLDGGPVYYARGVPAFFLYGSDVSPQLERTRCQQYAIRYSSSRETCISECLQHGRSHSKDLLLFKSLGDKL